MLRVSLVPASRQFTDTERSNAFCGARSLFLQEIESFEELENGIRSQKGRDLISTSVLWDMTLCP